MCPLCGGRSVNYPGHVSDETTGIVHRTLLGDAWEEADLAVAVFGDDRRFVAANAAFFRLTQYGRSELSELRAGLDLGADDATRRQFESVVRDGVQSGNGRLRCKDGSAVEVHFTVATTRIAGLPYFIAVLHPGS